MVRSLITHTVYKTRRVTNFGIMKFGVTHAPSNATAPSGNGWKCSVSSSRRTSPVVRIGSARAKQIVCDSGSWLAAAVLACKVTSQASGERETDLYLSLNCCVLHAL